MSTNDDFAAAQTRIKQLPKTPASDELLELYAYYKQATVGDAVGVRPGMLDFKGRAKFDAWSVQKGMSADDAMRAYSALVAKLLAKYE
jgi:acyl-CoA-binding protein